MEDNIELFDRYIDSKLEGKELQEFESRLKNDREFAGDFRAYLLIIDGVRKEAAEEDLEFGHAIRSLTEAEVCRAIGREDHRKRRFAWTPRLRSRLALAATVAAIVIVGGLLLRMITLSAPDNTESDRIDDIIVAYNYIPDFDRGGEAMPPADPTSLEKAYRDAPADDVQAQQDAGMRLAMWYLHAHDREMTRAILRELVERYPDDEEFTAQCNRILDQLK